MFELVKKDVRGSANVGIKYKPNEAFKRNVWLKVYSRFIWITTYAISDIYNWCELEVDRQALKIKLICTLGKDTQDSYKIFSRHRSSVGMGVGASRTYLPLGMYPRISSEDNIYIFQHESML